MDAPIRRLDDVDLPECLDLAVSRGWLRAERQWRVLFEVGEAYGIEDPSGGLAACAILTNLGEELAAVSMVVVAERFGRQGRSSTSCCVRPSRCGSSKPAVR